MCGGGGEYVSSAGGGGLGWGLASGPETGAESSSGPALSIAALSIAALSSKQRPTCFPRTRQDSRCTVHRQWVVFSNYDIVY